MAVYIDYADIESVDVSQSIDISTNRHHHPLNLGQEEPCILIDDESEDFDQKVQHQVQNNVISSMQNAVLPPAAEDDDDDCLIVGISQEDDDNEDSTSAPAPVSAMKRNNRILDYPVHPDDETDLGYFEGDERQVINEAIPTGIYSNLGANDGLPHAAKPSQSHSKSAKKFYCLECRAVCSKDHEHGRPEAEIPPPKAKNRKYPCSICEKMFTNLYEYLQHCQTCQLYAKCSQCEEVFVDAKLLEEHVVNVHNRKTPDLITSSLAQVGSSSTPVASVVISKTDSEQEPVSSSSGLLDTSLSYLCPYCNDVLEGGDIFDTHIRAHDPHVTEIKLEQLKYHTQILNGGGLKVNVEDLNKEKKQSSKRKRKTSDQAKSGGKNRKVGPALGKQGNRNKPATKRACTKPNETPKTMSKRGKSDAIKNQTKTRMKSSKNENNEKNATQKPPRGASSTTALARNEESEKPDQRKARQSNQTAASAKASVKEKRQCNVKSSSKVIKNMKKKTHLNREIVYTSKGKIFKCKDCGHENKNWISFMGHIKRNKCHVEQNLKPKPKNSSKKKIDDEDDGFLKCPDCDCRFLYLYNLERHSTVHAKKTQKRCKICFVIFSNNADLAKHENKFHKSDSKA